jgi:two-component system, OmpR family, phosphate regulon sensor histidine kinase PhoR
MLRKRLLWNIFLPFMAVVVVALVLITMHTSRSLRSFFYEQMRTDLANRAQLLIAAIQPLLEAGDHEAIQAFAREHGYSGDIRITVVLPDGRVIGESHDDPARMDSHDLRAEVAPALAGRTSDTIRYSTTLRQHQMYVAVPVQRNGEVVAVLRTAHALTTIDQALAVVQQRIALGGVLLALGAAAVSFGLARGISAPLRTMRVGAARFARGRLDTRLKTASTSEEIVALAEALNAMAAQLEERITTIEKQRNEQEAVLASMVECVLAIDRDETIIRLNQASCDVFGLDRQTVLGRGLAESVRNPGLLRLARQALGGSEPVEGEIILRRDGERHLQVHATGLQNPAGQRLGALLVLNDVTRMRRLENLRRDFVANVSHELRTPITSIKGFVETLQTDPPPDPAASARFLAIINRQADRLQAIIDDLLCLSRLEQDDGPASLAREDTRVIEILLDAVNVCTARAADQELPVRIECPPDLRLPANAALLEQAVVNLLDNALKHSGTTREVLITARAEHGRVAITVQDEGRGIAPEHLPRIFERFYRADRARSRALGGTGLGLAIVKHIAQAHGGEATVTSTVGEGSAFAIVLPTDGRVTIDT